jgi:hypothetical protein
VNFRKFTWILRTDVRKSIWILEIHMIFGPYRPGLTLPTHAATLPVFLLSTSNVRRPDLPCRRTLHLTLSTTNVRTLLLRLPTHAATLRPLFVSTHAAPSLANAHRYSSGLSYVDKQRAPTWLRPGLYGLNFMLISTFVFFTSVYTDFGPFRSRKCE